MDDGITRVPLATNFNEVFTAELCYTLLTKIRCAPSLVSSRPNDISDIHPLLIVVFQWLHVPVPKKISNTCLISRYGRNIPIDFRLETGESSSDASVRTTCTLTAADTQAFPAVSVLPYSAASFHHTIHGTAQIEHTKRKSYVSQCTRIPISEHEKCCT
jgi:hypothetical protein